VSLTVSHRLSISTGKKQETSQSSKSARDEVSRRDARKEWMQVGIMTSTDGKKEKLRQLQLSEGPQASQKRQPNRCSQPNVSSTMTDQRPREARLGRAEQKGTLKSGSPPHCPAPNPLSQRQRYLQKRVVRVSDTSPSPLSESETQGFHTKSGLGRSGQTAAPKAGLAPQSDLACLGHFCRRSFLLSAFVEESRSFGFATCRLHHHSWLCAVHL
jgi:hypothetical protein